MDYRKTAQAILDQVGGSKNIVSAAHCATRLRLVIADNSKADKEAIENVDGVKGVFEASGQLQIILGTGTVNKVFDEFISIAGITASSKAEAKEAAAQKQNIFMRAVKLLGDIFVPIIPAIVASGFLMGIMNSLDFMINNGFISMDTSSSIYVFANLFSNTAYTFLQILIAFSAANVAQGEAALAVALKSRDKKIKSLALPSSLSAFMGITEPAIFGVNLRFFRPFIAGCIGGGCGALYASLVHLGAKGTGVTGIFGILLCLEQPVQYVIEMAIAVGVAFVISFIIYKDQKPERETAGIEDKNAKAAASGTDDESKETAESVLISEETIKSPVKGRIIPLSEVSDETFASEMLGVTSAVEPDDGRLVSPCDGEVINVFDTGHAVCIATKSGGELLIHIGVDTVKLNGKGFTKKVSDGDHVHAGAVLLEAEEKAESGEVGTDAPVMTLKK